MPFDIQAEMTLKTNFFATRNVCTELLPIVKPHDRGPRGQDVGVWGGLWLSLALASASPVLQEWPHPAPRNPDGIHAGRDFVYILLGKSERGRVVNISSSQGFRALEDCGEALQERFRCNTLTEGDLVDLMKKFVEDVKNEVHEREGWPDSAYGVSKLGVTVLSRIIARQLDEKRKADRILLNACCPGDTAGDQGSRSLEQGVETPVYLALLPPDATEPHGQFICDKVVQNW
ncbi:carbonyl reductase [NADPH] 3 isoform X3 [Cavia porcellus]